MSGEHWKKAKEILGEALKLAPENRAAFLDKVCSDDNLRREIEILLASSENVGSFMEQAAIGEVAEMFESEDKNLTSGALLSHFKIIEPLGAGGMGKVYLAEDLHLHRQVALKVLPNDVAADKDSLRRFEQEALAASALNHPNILTIYEIVEANGSRFIASEYVKGETLRQRIPNLSIMETLDIAVQIATALDAAHQSGIIHRDIKPENIMRREDGLIKVLDFGLAKMSEPPPLDAEAETRALVQTKSGLIMGTVAYMSPEQAGGKKVDARTDIFSFGVVMYEMLSGKLPFEGDSSNDVIAAILKTEPAPLSQYDVPKDLAHIVSKALRKKADERYQHVKDLLIDLRDFKQEAEFEAKLERSAAPAKIKSPTADKLATLTEIQNPQTTSSAEYLVSEIKQHKRGFVSVLAVLLVAVIGFGYWFFANRSINSAPIESIAVLPFQNASGNADVEYLSDGITESLISSLSQLSRLSVKARSSVFRYKGKEIEIKKIGQELSVQAVLIGRVVQRENNLTLFVELVDAATEKVLWSENYTRSLSNLVALQSEIARDISNKLRTKLSGADEQRVTKKYTKNTEAFKLYLQGRYYSSRNNPEKIKKGIEFFEQAIALDPNYALAYAGIADTYYNLSYLHLPPKEAMPKAKAAALKALEIDDTLSEAHTSLALVKTFYDWEWSGAEKEYKQAIELNQNNAQAHEWYGWYLALVGRPDESLAEIKRAEEINPFSTGWSLGVSFFFAHRYDQAIEQLQKTIEMEPNIPLAHFHLAASYEQKGMYNEAIEEFRKASDMLGGSTDASLGHAYAVSGKRDEALKMLGELKERAARGELPGLRNGNHLYRSRRKRKSI